LGKENKNVISVYGISAFQCHLLNHVGFLRVLRFPLTQTKPSCHHPSQQARFV